MCGASLGPSDIPNVPHLGYPAAEVSRVINDRTARYAKLAKRNCPDLRTAPGAKEPVVMRGCGIVMRRGDPGCLNRISASVGRGHRCPPLAIPALVKVSYRPCHNRERRAIATERRRSLTAPHEVPMLHPYIRTLTLAAALGACSALSFASSAHAAPFDGSWSVLVVTRSGSCGPPSDAANEPIEHFERFTAVNQRGVWACMKHELGVMREQGAARSSTARLWAISSGSRNAQPIMAPSTPCLE
jgi:hypothetical protein